MSSNTIALTQTMPLPRVTRLLVQGVASLATLMVLATPLRAQDITIGGAASGTNVAPFSSYSFLPNNRYQQMYSASLFGNGPLMIDALRFYNTKSVAGGLPGSIAEGNYLIRLGITSKTENGLSTNFDSNVTGTQQLFYSGYFAPNSLRIAGNSFLYDPTQGNLLLDVIVLNQATVGFLGLDYSNSANDGTSRAYNTWPLPFQPSQGAADKFGLITTFETSAPAVVPEPATMLLTASGMMLVGVFARRRKSRG